MNCPKCNAKISDKLIAKHLAAKGGKTCGPTKARDPEKMRAAVNKRWAKARQNGGAGDKNAL